MRLALSIGFRGNTRVAVSVDFHWFLSVLLILLALWIGLGG